MTDAGTDKRHDGVLNTMFQRISKSVLLLILCSLSLHSLLAICPPLVAVECKHDQVRLSVTHASKTPSLIYLFWRCGLTYKGQAWTAQYALVFCALVQACPGYLVCDSYRKACYCRVLVHNCMQTFCLYWISAVHCKCVNVSVYFSFYTFFSVPFCSNVPSTTATTNN